MSVALKHSGAFVLYVFKLFLLYMSVQKQREYRTNQHSCHTEYPQKHCCSRALALAENSGKEASCGLLCHKRFGSLVDEYSAEQSSYGYGEELQRIPAGVDPTLHLRRDSAAEDNVKLRSHDGDEQPAADGSHAPYYGRI